jgi:hypothetical protein
LAVGDLQTGRDRARQATAAGLAVGDLQTGRDLHGKPPRQAGVVSPSRRGQRGGISFKPWPWGGCLMGGGEVQRAKRKERAEKRESREKKREKIFRRNERREKFLE